MAAIHRKVVTVAKLLTLALLSAVLIVGCAVEVQNTQPAQEVARLAKPPGSVPVGWRVFQERCAQCHGAQATGGSGIPNLLPLVREMGSREFVSVVLTRYDKGYDWGLPQSRERAALQPGVLDSVLKRDQGQITMPAWQGEPIVTAHILDLYAYLSARAQGSQGTGRPEQ
jgi:Cytochrome C oxidase, cbb3-type, subunit III